MVIDGNELETEAMRYFLAGDNDTGNRLQEEFVAEFHRALREERLDHCSCQTKNCKYHGKCIDCVAIHRAHRDHLPNCFHSMVNERIARLSELTGFEAD